MKNIALLLILSIMMTVIACHKSFMIKKEDENLSYLEENDGLLYHAYRKAEKAKYTGLYDSYAFSINALDYSVLNVNTYSWREYNRSMDVQIKDLYRIHTPKVDSFLTGTLIAASTILMIHQGLHKDTYFRISRY